MYVTVIINKTTITIVKSTTTNNLERLYTITKKSMPNCYWIVIQLIVHSTKC